MRSLRSLPTSLLTLLTTITVCTLPALAEDAEVQIETTTAADCNRPSKFGDKVAVHYKGTLQTTGEEFDQSYKRGKPIQFILGAGQVIQGWEQGLLEMCPGEGRKLTIPSELAYGDRGSPPVIPPGATLVFETELVDIVGVKQESVEFEPTPSTSEQSFAIATAPSTPPSEDEKDAEKDDDAEGDDDADHDEELQATPLTDTVAAETTQQGQCHLLGPFAIMVQGALGAMAILSLVYKRWRETPKRPWKIWFFDVSKQVVGSILLHILNVLMSQLGAIDMDGPQKAVTKEPENGQKPNPCSFYLLNLGIDTTLGIPVLYLLLKVLHIAFRYTPLARPAESIKSGNYGQPPKVSWWLKQSLIYFIGLVGMKAFVLFLFAVLPWLPWVGDWALRWTEGNEALQIAFVMFIFPLAMNALQYWIIDSLIMDKDRGKGGLDERSGYQQVHNQDDDDDSDSQGETIVTEERVRGKNSGEEPLPPLQEVNPTPIPQYDESPTGEGRGEDSRNVRPVKG